MARCVIGPCQGLGICVAFPLVLIETRVFGVNSRMGSRRGIPPRELRPPAITRSWDVDRVWTELVLPPSACTAVTADLGPRPDECHKLFGRALPHSTQFECSLLWFWKRKPSPLMSGLLANLA